MDCISYKLSDLITGSKAGRESEFAQLYEIIYPLLSSYANRRVYNQQTASDIVSNSVVKIVRSIAIFDYKSDASFYGWMYKIAQNEISTAIKKESKYSFGDVALEDQEIEDVRSSHYHLEDDIDKASDIDKLRRALAKLPKCERQIIDLYYFAHATHQQIAASLNITEGNSRVKLKRAVTKLRVTYDSNFLIKETI
jgi:RNA polymerase sigma-70 factor, ECF subfamily